MLLPYQVSSMRMNLSSNSNTSLVTQQSVKAYVDSQVGDAGLSETEVDARVTTGIAGIPNVSTAQRGFFTPANFSEFNNIRNVVGASAHQVTGFYEKQIGGNVALAASSSTVGNLSLVELDEDWHNYDEIYFLLTSVSSSTAVTDKVSTRLLRNLPVVASAADSIYAHADGVVIGFGRSETVGAGSVHIFRTDRDDRLLVGTVMAHSTRGSYDIQATRGVRRQQTPLDSETVRTAVYHLNSVQDTFIASTDNTDISGLNGLIGIQINNEPIVFQEASEIRSLIVSEGDNQSDVSNFLTVAGANTVRTICIGWDNTNNRLLMAYRPIVGLTTYSGPATLKIHTISGEVATHGLLSYDQSQSLTANEITQVHENLGISPFAKTLIDDTSVEQARATLGLHIGSQVQQWDSDLQAIANLNPGSGQILRSTSSGFTGVTLSDFMVGMLNDGSAATARGTIGAQAAECGFESISWFQYN